MTRIIWLFSLVLGHSRHIVARFVLHQDLQTLLRCHMAAFEAIGGVPIEILYDRMKTAVTGENHEGHIVYNRSLVALALEGRRQYRVDPGHRQGGAGRAMRRGYEEGIVIGRRGDHVARRSLAFYQAIGCAANGPARARTAR